MGLSPLKDVVIRLSLIQRESLWRGTFIWNCKWLPESKTCICAIQLTFFWKTPHIVSARRSQKVLLFTWKIFSAFQNLTPADGCLTHPYTWHQRTACTDCQTFLHLKFRFRSTEGNGGLLIIMGWRDNSNHLVRWTGNKLLKRIYHTKKIIEN